MAEEFNLDKAMETIRPIKPKKDRKECDRLTAQLAVYHEHCGDDPHAVNIHFAEQLDTVDEARTRTLKVGPTWQPLRDISKELPAQVGYIVIQNRTGLKKFGQTQAERDAVVGRDLVIRTGDESGWIVPPGRFFMGSPEMFDTIQIKSALGFVDIRVTVFPR